MDDLRSAGLRRPFGKLQQWHGLHMGWSVEKRECHRRREAEGEGAVALVCVEWGTRDNGSDFLVSWAPIKMIFAHPNNAKRRFC